MGLDDVATGDLDGPHAAVVGALRGRVALDWPAKRATLQEEGVLLLDAEDGLLVGVLLVNLHAGRSRIARVGGHLPVGQANVAQH